MTTFIPIQYSTISYPGAINPKIREVPSHFDCSSPGKISGEYSLHTEYSYGKRQFRSFALNGLTTISTAHRNGVPQLWFSDDWSSNFAKFVINYIGENKPPKIIEIHPPFSDYCSTIDCFLDRYELFANNLSKVFPDSEYLIENRCGSIYSGERFLVSTCSDLLKLTDVIQARRLHLRIVLDIPQLFTAHRLELQHITSHELSKTLNALNQFKELVHGIHIWGKKLSEKGRIVAHVGDMNSYFFHRQDLKETFFEELYKILDDGKFRYFVPEVNSGEKDLQSIVTDFLDHGFRFKTNGI